MAECERCRGTGTNECPECGGSGHYNKDGEIVDCLNCGRDGQPAGYICCPYCDDGWVAD